MFLYALLDLCHSHFNMISYRSLLDPPRGRSSTTKTDDDIKTTRGHSNILLCLVGKRATCMPPVPHHHRQREQLELECTSCEHMHPSRPVRLTNPCKFSTIHKGEDNETFFEKIGKKEVVENHASRVLCIRNATINTFKHFTIISAC
jgi:hypothetical protein